MKNKFISTAIFYANSRLHIGNSYEIVYADAIARYARLKQEEVFFLTGMDEHGQKIEESAKQLQIAPQAHVDKLANDAKDLFEHLQISYDYFIRTTDVAHQEVVLQIFEQLLKQGDIYLDKYEGNYCMSCEAFYLDKELVDGHCPNCGKQTTIISEDSYFLNLKKYEAKLIKYYKEHPDFIIPKTKMNEMLAFLDNGLVNLSVTRTSFDWGIKVLSDPKHVVYVWIDALVNYISALGKRDSDKFNQFWNNGEVIHIIGKDILRFHGIYWPIILMALDVKLPDQIVVHGFILLNDDKMSKSVGNVVYSSDYTMKYGVDPIRYYLLTELSNGNDGSFTLQSFIERYNYDLVNDLSNLVNRSASMATKYFNEPIVKDETLSNEFEASLKMSLEQTITSYLKAMDNYDPKKALGSVFEFIHRVNKYVDETMPWQLAKTDKRLLKNVLYDLIESIRNISLLIKPCLPTTSDLIAKQFKFNVTNFTELGFNNKYEYNVLKPKIIYQRLDIEQELASMNQAQNSNEITIDDFNKVELKVATVTDCYLHPNADKLLVFKLLLGSEERQIVSGIAKFYEPETLIGKNVVIVANLAPVKLRGEISEGMILSAQLDDELAIIESSLSSGATVL